jgi:5-methylcytosine-specific restriction endonuclease McrA
MRRRRKPKPTQVSEGGLEHSLRTNKRRLRELQASIGSCQAQLDSIRTGLREFPQTLDERKKKQAELELEHERSPYVKEARERIALLSQLIQNRQKEKAAIESQIKSWVEQSNNRGFFATIFAPSFPFAEAQKKIKELERPTLGGRELNRLRENLSRPWCLFHGCTLDDEGFAKLKQMEQTAERDLARYKQEYAKVAAELRDSENKLRARYRVGDDTIAAAAAHFGKTRDLADKIKVALQAQLHITKDCPYCGLPLGDTMHADHIYPVSKGGLSTTENMVLICDKCNLQKGNKTLRQFISAYNFDRERIESALELLGKHF